MIIRPKISGATIPYQLRPHKAIERNLFVSMLKRLDRVYGIDLEKYRYVGFGAAFLEDFKALHSEFNIKDMDCVELDEYAFSRQKFNNPYHFINLFNRSSTDYINSTDFKQDLNQIVWWDYAAPKHLRQSLNDIELTAQKVSHLDVLKFTFNAEISSFLNTHFRLHNKVANYGEILKFLETDPTFKKYLPDTIKPKDIQNDFSEIIRSMALRAVRRGLASGNNALEFHHVCSFKYADGALMTTVTGIICEKNEYEQVMEESGLLHWDFYAPDTENELIRASMIQVPVMTVSERSEIDKRMHKSSPSQLAKGLQFKYGSGEEEEHKQLIEGYCKYYRYLPYYSKVIV